MKIVLINTTLSATEYCTLAQTFQLLTLMVVRKVVDTRSSNSITGVYKVSTFTICQEKQTLIKH